MFGRRLAGKVQSFDLESVVLKGNALGDPTTREVFVYTPKAYDGRTRLPVVLMLPAYGGSHHSPFESGLWKASSMELVDDLMASGACGPAIVVVPDACTSYGGSQFIDSTGTGPYQTFLADEVFAAVDGRFATIPTREGRAVVGRSSGGFGALRLGMDRPDVVSVVGSHAGDAQFEVSLRPMFVAAANAFTAVGGIAAFATKLRTEGPRGGSDYDAAFFLAAAAAYAPSPSDAAPHVALPFDPQTAELRADVWNRWLAQDPLDRMRRGDTNLAKAALVYLDAGNRDEYGLAFAARNLATALRDVGAKVVHEEFEGTHRGTGHRFTASFPRIVSALAQD